MYSILEYSGAKIQENSSDDPKEQQAGSRPGVQIQDHIFSLRMTAEKAWGRGRNLFSEFLDLKAAFPDRRSGMFSTGEKCVIQSVYKDRKGMVRFSRRQSEQLR